MAGGLTFPVHTPTYLWPYLPSSFAGCFLFSVNRPSNPFYVTHHQVPPGPSKPGSPSASPLGKSAGEARWGSPLGKSSAFGQRLCCTTSIVSPLCSQRRTARSSMDSGKREPDESVWGKGKANAVING
ncbi:hypothetical protein VE01_07865 [Pseudogymnoascus verrucosus]|uniref:Uncharacterized protein n=1 Tax=Pseudogymnoascus verrucosus TaxID=342668 RepID=A0A1B8GEJ2_9PEZI|nr:uncharacterized protein VE01_07865 [Pseudogymnoascus verrucosus]OBT94252.1 hypothetical protein VE01_07865 [Pseudogymnoascus verrucosus]